jgi:pimeloyl-ACP methyl ester carboxylesterase
VAGVAGAGRAVADWAAKYPLAPRWRPEERVWRRAADGTRLFAARLDGPADAPLAVVLVHGMLNSSRSPKVHAFARRLARDVHVVAPDLRGHGASGGRCTLGHAEPADLAVAVDLAASAWGVPVVTVGTSLGGFVALLHAGLHGGVAGVVAISSPGLWMKADRPGAQRILRLVDARPGRLLAAALLRTRLSGRPAEAAAIDAAVGSIAPAFTVLVHDADDHFFGPDHAEHLHRVAGEPKELRWRPGAGHGIDVLTPDFADELVSLLRDRVPSR